jgi:hypothetical protein
MAGKIVCLPIIRDWLDQRGASVVGSRKKYTGLESEKCRNATRDLAVDPPWPLRRSDLRPRAHRRSLTRGNT